MCTRRLQAAALPLLLNCVGFQRLTDHLGTFLFFSLPIFAVVHQLFRCPSGSSVTCDKNYYRLVTCNREVVFENTWPCLRLDTNAATFHWGEFDRLLPLQISAVSANALRL